ncbi:ACD11 dehydrogenase, partial [Amia calva]|nr:ACD11 dehydrogenase [Amia calva]
MDEETSRVREQHTFNVATLQQYLSDKIRGFPNTVVNVRQYRSGQSNPTFLLQAAHRSYVLRKKPPGALLPGAHRVDREFGVQRALFSARFPVPRPLLYCGDVSVIGTEFYVMEHVQGRIFRDPRLPGISAAERAAIYLAAVEVLARLHSLDLSALDLKNYGKGSGYCERQVLTWTKQYRAAAHTDIPAMDKLIDWLSSNLPSNDSEVTLVHGDFRLDNVIFHPTETRVLAVLDWELSTTGHPIVDLAYFLMPYYWPRGLNFIDTMGAIRGITGIPAPEELISVYCRCRSISNSLPHWSFFQALSFFKMAGIAQGIYARHLLGNASSPEAYKFGESVEPLAGTGLRIALSTMYQYKIVFPVSDYCTLNVMLCTFTQSLIEENDIQRISGCLRRSDTPVSAVELCSSFRVIFGLFVASLINALLAWSVSFGGRPSLGGEALTISVFQEVAEYYLKHANSPLRWSRPEVITKLKERARASGLWNLFLPAVSGLSQLDYAFVAEETGKCFFAPEIFNCQAPDTGNMEVLHKYGTEEQKRQWLEPLLQGEITSCFCMTEPNVASSDATNMETSLHREGDTYVINGKKWWSSGAGNTNCKVAVVLCRSQAAEHVDRHKQHSMILVPLDTQGVKIIRPLTVFGQDDASHGGHFEVHFDNVCVPLSNILVGEGRGFEIAQGRLGPGRLHHCMRAVGLAERALELLCRRAATRQTFGKKLYKHEVVAHWIAECRIAIDQSRLLTLSAANAIDVLGSATARKQIAMIKVTAARMACKVVDCAIQVFGGAGVSGDFPLAQMYSAVRTLRIADGPDEVHLSSIAYMELRDQLQMSTAKL